jgi:hypothetical protein
MQVSTDADFLAVDGLCCCYISEWQFFIIPVYLQSVQAHSVNWLKEVDEWLGDRIVLAGESFTNRHCDYTGRDVTDREVTSYQL